jgi:hypothetical protein
MASTRERKTIEAWGYVQREIVDLNVFKAHRRHQTFQYPLFEARIRRHRGIPVDNLDRRLDVFRSVAQIAVAVLYNTIDPGLQDPKKLSESLFRVRSMHKSLHCIRAIEGTFCEAVAVDILFRLTDVITHHKETRNQTSATVVCENSLF